MPLCTKRSHILLFRLFFNFYKEHGASKHTRTSREVSFIKRKTFKGCEFEVHAAVNMKISLFWNATICNFMDRFS